MAKQYITNLRHSGNVPPVGIWAYKSAILDCQHGGRKRRREKSEGAGTTLLFGKKTSEGEGGHRSRGGCCYPFNVLTWLVLKFLKDQTLIL